MISPTNAAALLCLSVMMGMTAVASPGLAPATTAGTSTRTDPYINIVDKRYKPIIYNIPGYIKHYSKTVKRSLPRNDDANDMKKINPGIQPTLEYQELKRITKNNTLFKDTPSETSKHISPDTSKSMVVKPVMKSDSGIVGTKLNKSSSQKTTTILPSARYCVHRYNKIEQSARVSMEGTDSGLNYDYEYAEEREPILSNRSLEGQDNVRVEECVRPTEFCYAFWTENNSGEITILGQGCWESSDRQAACAQSSCVPERPPPRARPSTKFCCCREDLCNAQPISPPPNTGVPLLEVVTPADPIPQAGGYGGAAIAAGLAASALAGFAILACRLVGRRSDKSADTIAELGNGPEAGGPGFSCSATCVDNLKLDDNIGSGRYAKVWRGSLGGVAVAVKALPASRQALWARERDLYCLPHMRHPHLLTYLGCDTRDTLDGCKEHLLVLQLAPLGSLRQYLTAHTLDWDCYSGMALGVASALAHLHTHIHRDDQYKPCIVHRDVNSSNVVVRADRSVCLTDLGLAMALPDSRGRPSQPHQHRITEAGTLRYLAPEALEGALDLRRCAAALRAVDVYALALVLWELLSRCAPLHRPPGPAPYAAPFMAEVGENPTLEQMQVVVARRKARPLFSPRLLGARGARLARDTCEDCWDHDAEARLTAVCVVERLSELRSLRPAPSPTINSNDLRPPAPNQDGAPNWHSPSGTDDKNSNLTSSIITNQLSNGNVTTVFDFQANSIHSQPLQPHQGRNPCLERNLALAGPGDRLIDKSLKDMPSNSSTSSTNGYGTNDYVRMEQSVSGSNLRNQPQDFSRPEEHNLNTGQFGASRNSNRVFSNQNIVSADILGLNQDDQIPGEFRLLTRPITPIGYVQNDVSSDANGTTHGNGDNGHYVYPAKQTNLKIDSSQRWSTKNLRKLLDSKVFRRRNLQSRPTPLETEVNLVLANGKPINNGFINTSNGKFKTSIIINDTKCKNTQDDSRLNYARNTDITSADRPSTLPGLDPVSSNASAADGTSRELSGLVKLDTWKNQPNFTHNNICTLSPPNQTVSVNMMLQNEGNRNNLVMGFKELPNFGNTSSDLNNSQPGNIKSPNQIFAVIVPKPMYNPNSNSSRDIDVSEWQQRNNILLSTLTNLDRNKKIENKLVTSDNPERASGSNSHNVYSAKNGERLGHIAGSKRHSCDEKIFNSGNNSLYGVDSFLNEQNGVDTNAKHTQNRKSYSGEFEVGNFCVYNEENNCYDPNMVDYSSNSEDEHMLLLSENGGSKITMRQRFDAKPNESKKRKSRQSASLNPQDGGSLSKIAAGSFSSLCNKYGPKNKYENFDNESSEKLLDNNLLDYDKIIDDVAIDGNTAVHSTQEIRKKSSSIDRNDIPYLSRNKIGSNLSICKGVDDTSFIDLGETTDRSESSRLSLADKENIDVNTEPIAEKKGHFDDSTDSDDDLTLRDEVFSKDPSRAPRPLSIKQNLSRQHSLELVSEIFSSSADLTRLRDPANRIKTPGDVPPSVRRVRGSQAGPRIKRTGSTKETSKTTANRLSLYDDRMMFGNSL